MYHLRKNISSEKTEEFYYLAFGLKFTTKSYSACIINGVTLVTHPHDSRCKTQNCVISIPEIDGNIFYCLLKDITELPYLNNYAVVLFKSRWISTNPLKKKLLKDHNITSTTVNSELYNYDPLYIYLSSTTSLLY